MRDIPDEILLMGCDFLCLNRDVELMRTILTRTEQPLSLDKIIPLPYNRDMQMELDFEQTKASKKRELGGGKSHAKRARPFLKNKWMHVCLKSSKAKGPLSLLTPKNKETVRRLVLKLKKKYFIEIKDGANVGDHLHMAIRTKHREDFQNFLRELTTQLARKITGAKKGKPFGQFWDGLTYSRLLTTAKELLALRGYIKANRIQVTQGYQARQKYLSDFRAWVSSLKKKVPT